MTLSQIVMFDGTDPSQFPAAPAAVAGYVAGRWPDFRTLTAMFPHARALSIAVSAGQDAECLDIETGDARPEDAPGWHERQRKRGVIRPCLYASVDLMQAQLIPVLKGAGIDRAAVRLWSAHYAGKHICGPASCGELSIEADGTQHSDHAFGRDLDQSLLAADFFAVPAPKPPAPSPVPAWQEAMMQALPTVRQGDSGEVVRTIQGLCIARGHPVTVDGQFGPATHEAVTAVQTARHLAADGIVGPATWPPLMGL